MQFDAALVAQESSRRAEAELGPDRHQPSHSKTVFLLTQVDRGQDLRGATVHRLALSQHSRLLCPLYFKCL